MSWKDKGVAALNLLVVPWLARKAWGYIKHRKAAGFIKTLDKALSGAKDCPPQIAQAVDVLKRAQFDAAKAELMAASEAARKAAARAELAMMRSKAKKK